MTEEMKKFLFIQFLKTICVESFKRIQMRRKVVLLVSECMKFFFKVFYVQIQAVLILETNKDIDLKMWRFDLLSS